MPKAIYQYLEHFLESKFLILPILTILYWACFQIYTQNEIKDLNGFIFGILLGLLALTASFFSLLRSYEWEFTKSYLGLSNLFISLALMCWSIGQFIYLYSSINPLYESFYDYVFVLIDPLYLVGILFIAKSLNTFKNLISNLKIFLIPLIVFIINIFFVSLIRNEEFVKSLESFDFNLLFIFGSIILSTLVISILILSGKKIGGKFKSALYLILLGLILQYLADNLFEINDVFQQNGSLSDLIFFLSILFIFNGVIRLNPRSLK